MDINAFAIEQQPEGRRVSMRLRGHGMHQRQINLLINASSLLLGVVVVGYIVYDMTYTATTPPCSQRYGAAMRFPLHGADGKPFSAVALQARAGSGRNPGVLENASVVAVAGGPLPDALQVALRDVPDTSKADDAPRNGVEFRWTPFGQVIGTAACLSYHLHLPPNFDLGGGGVLPGLESGGSADSARAGSNGFSVQTRWDEHGQPLMWSSNESADTVRLTGASSLPIDRWAHIEQEAVLNTPGRNDSVLRLWIDGSLVAESTNLNLRTDPAAQISRVVIAAGYRRAPEPTPADTAELQISGIEIARPK